MSLETGIFSHFLTLALTAYRIKILILYIICMLVISNIINSFLERKLLGAEDEVVMVTMIFVAVCI